jgi:hypothetical protein
MGAAMKSAIVLSFLLSCCGSLLADNSLPAPPRRSGVLDEIVHMSQAGAPEDTVLAYAQAHRAELPSRVSDADLQWLRQAGVSERAVRYLRAVDVRIPEGAGPQGYPNGYAETAPPRYSAPPQDQGYDQAYADNGYVGYDSSSGPYDDNGFYNYWYTPYFNPYPYAYYPYYYPYYPYYAFNGHGFHHHGGNHVDHHHDGNGHWGDGGHQGNGGGHGGSGDAWRSRGSVAQRNNPMTMGPRGSGRQAYARGSIAAAPRGYRGNVVGRGNMVGRGAPAMARSGGMPRGAAPTGPRGGGFGGGGHGGARSSGGSSGGHGRR